VLSIAAGNTGVIYTGTSAGGVYRSANGGTAWDDVNIGITNMKINALAMNGTDEVFAGTNGGMFRSSDNGDNWTQINNGLTNHTITDIAVHKSGHIFITTDAGGVFTSADNGNTWTPLNTGLSSISTTCISVDSSDYIYCGTNDGLLFRSLIPYTGLTDISQNSLQLLQNFPNPFNSSTIIPFILKKEGCVLITISDINGKHIETVVDAGLPAGYHQFKWNPNNMCAGIYIAVIFTDDAISKIFMTFANN
ncbi:MAG: T9SS type A sorting domain-containing protein, partial [Bacteroidota bacterium]